LNGHKIYDDTTRTNRSALFETCAKIEIRSGSKSFFDARNTTTTQRAALPCDCSKIERNTMNDFRELIDDIRQAERELSTVANRRQDALAQVAKTSKAIEEQTDNLGRLSLTEQALSEAGSRYSSKAQRAIRRGLSVNEVDEVLDPLTRRAMIQAATHLTLTAKDEAGKTMLELQRLDSQAKETLASLETAFAAAEDKLEALRDDLRILQSQPTA
jgi:chromosome segregation ATPase